MCFDTVCRGGGVTILYVQAIPISKETGVTLNQLHSASIGLSRQSMGGLNPPPPPCKLIINAVQELQILSISYSVTPP